MFKSIIVTLIVLISCQSLAQKIYKWVDANGQIHYSSQKPDNENAEPIKLKKPPKKQVTAVEEELSEASNTDNSEMSAAEQAAEEEAKEAAKAQLAAADRVNNKKQCELAKRNFAALNATVRVTKVNDQGETVRMTDDQRVNAMQQAQKGIKQYCQ